MTNRTYNNLTGELLIMIQMIAKANNEDVDYLYDHFTIELPTIEEFDLKQYLLDQTSLMMQYCIKHEQYEICKELQDITRKINKK